MPSKDRWQQQTLFILPLWLVELPIAIIFHFYQISVPQWEPFVPTISIQGVVIVFGIFVYLFRLNHYCGLPELAALIGVIIGVPTSMIWQYLPPHGNPIPQYGVIALTFGCSTICCFLQSVWPRLRRLGGEKAPAHFFSTHHYLRKHSWAPYCPRLGVLSDIRTSVHQPRGRVAPV
jgi:hypothetical protein